MIAAKSSMPPADRALRIFIKKPLIMFKRSKKKMILA
jgi:hypothetical protein